MTRTLVFALALAAAVGCRSVDWEGSGDAAAARGDHAAALDAYKRVPPAQATPGLGGKVERATAAVVEDHLRRATRALEDGRFEEALTIARTGGEIRADERLRAVERDAKARLVDTAVETGRGHARRGDHAAAIAQYELALRYDASPSTRDLLAEAKAAAARDLVARAQKQAASGDLEGAMATIDKALAYHDIPEHRAARDELRSARDAKAAAAFQARVDAGKVARAAGEWARAASEFEAALQHRRAEPAIGLGRYCADLAAADAAISQQAYAEAVARLTAAAKSGHDEGEAQSRLDSLEEKRVELVAAGRERLAEHDWAGARTAFARARGIGSDAELQKLQKYVEAMGDADAALGKRDLQAALREYERAVALGLDDGGYAASRRDAVRPSTWAVTLKSVTARPFKADDSVWDEALTKALKVERILAGYEAKAAGAEAAEAASNLIPEKNLPDLFVRIRLPDGRTFRTAPGQGTLHHPLNVTFTVTGHVYEEGAVEITVCDADGDQEEVVGRVRTTVGGMLAKGSPAAWSADQCYELAVTLENRGQGAPAGVVEGAQAEAEPDLGNEAEARSKPREGTTAFRLRVRRLRIADADAKPADEKDGAADPQLVIQQGGATVLKTPAVSDTPDVKWPGDDAPRTWLYVGTDEPLDISLFDAGNPDAPPAVAARISSADLGRGKVRLESTKGSLIELDVTK